MKEPLRIASRDNPLLRELRRLVQDGSAYRREGRVWLEGEHLCAAWIERGHKADQAVLSESGWTRPVLRGLAQMAGKLVVLPDALFAGLSTLESPAAIGLLVGVPQPDELQPDASTMVLDRLQDAGNVGSMLRSAAAFGVRQVVALKGTVALWSPKVLRAGMGAHAALSLIEAAEESLLDGLHAPLVATSSHAERALTDGRLPSHCAWVFGQEGQGVSVGLLQRCSLELRIPQPGGEESLNVAAAAAVCLYESARQRLAVGPSSRKRKAGQ